MIKLSEDSERALWRYIQLSLPLDFRSIDTFVSSSEKEVVLNGEKRGHFRNNNQTRHRSSPDSPILAMKMFVEWRNFRILRKQTSKKQVLSFSGPGQKNGRKRSELKTYQLVKFVVHIYWRLFLVSIFNLNKTNYPTIRKHLITRDINNFTLFTSKENASAGKSVSFSFQNIFQNWVYNRLVISYRRIVKSIIIQSALPIALNFQWQGENFSEKSLKFIVFWDFYLLGENSDIIIETFCGCQFARSVVTRRVWR